MKVGDYVRTKSGGIGKIIEIDNNCSCSHIITDNETFGLGWDLEQVNWDFITEIIKSSPDIIDLLKPMDLLYIDIDNGYAGGIIVPRIAETQAELNLMIDLIKSGKWILKDVVTNEQLDSMKYEVGD